MGIIIGIMIGWTIIAYILILAGSKSKTEEERRYEDEEQMEWIRKNMRGGKYGNRWKNSKSDR